MQQTKVDDGVIAIQLAANIILIQRKFLEAMSAPQHSSEDRAIADHALNFLAAVAASPQWRSCLDQDELVKIALTDIAEEIFEEYVAAGTHRFVVVNGEKAIERIAP